ncbi:Aldo/keto reductase [Irpex rosettiformis]|uniref:Aldo/keto reductase n=1 Tax=Irpex rosettiformis TaxID=378272 RepID=A0ACB8TVX2_9APHY|nr:Aldo/keto reductase [Irpex rosettiformis]
MTRKYSNIFKSIIGGVRVRVRHRPQLVTLTRRETHTSTTMFSANHSAYTPSPTVVLNDGTSMPTLIYGSGTALRDKDASHAISSAIQVGYRHIDCAQMYKNEQSVGRGISLSGVPRDELYITTKILPVPEGSSVVATLRDSLAKMGLGYVDMCLIHEPVGHRDLVRTWREVMGCKEAGLCRSIGVSNFRVEDLELLKSNYTDLPTVNQIEYNPYLYEANKRLLEYLAECNIVTVSYCGLAPITRVSNGPLDTVLPQIAQRVSESAGETVTPGQVLQLWLRRQGLPYVSTTWKPERLKEYLRVATLPDLTDEEERLISERGSTVHHRFFVRSYTKP